MSSIWDSITGVETSQQIEAAQQQQSNFEQQYLAQQASQNSPEALQAKVKSYGTILLYVVIIVILIVVIKKVFF